MLQWWASLNGPEQFFYMVALTSTTFLLFQLLLNLIGVGIDADVEVDGGGVEHASGLGLISIRTVIAFFVGFGWAGVAMLEQGTSIELTVAVATGTGVVFMLIVFSLMKVISGFSESGNVDNKNAEGQTGIVYTPIPKKMEGTGQIQVKVQGRLRELTAVTDEEEALATGTPIEVIKAVSSDTMLVRCIKI